MNTTRPIAILATGLLLLLSACGKDNKADDSRTITVATMGGAWQQRVAEAVKPEMDKLGIKVRYLPLSAQEVLPKLIAARGETPPFDVLEVDDQTYVDLRNGAFLDRLDAAKLPNLADVDPKLHDDEKVAYWISQPSIIYNRKKFAEAGLRPPARYSDLAAPELAAKVGLGHLEIYTGFYLLTALAAENGGNAANPQPGFDVLARIKPHSYLISTTTIAQLFAAGDLWAITMPAGFAVRLADAGGYPTVVQPRINGKLQVAHGYLAVPKRGRNRDAALAFINATISARAQRILYEQTAIIPSNSKALQAVAANQNDPGREFQTLDTREIADGFVPDFAAIDRKDWIRRWDRAVAAQPR